MSILRKIGRILLLVGGIFSLLAMGLCFLLAIASFVLPAFGEQIAGENAQFVMIGGIAGGVVLLIAAVLCLVAGVVGIKGFKTHEKGNYVANIVFGVLTAEWLLIAGAVLGLIALAKEKKAAAPEEPAPEEAPAAE